MAMTETRIRTGAVRGLETETPGISVFLGIPYAQPAAGQLRWHAPVPAKPWEGVRDCFDYGFSCWQASHMPPARPNAPVNPVPARPLRMDEDCLNLNVWTPAESAEERLPVMVWFYGGGLQRGTADNIVIDGEGLCKHGVLLVSVNYRTGVFGFFGHPELEAENEHHSSSNYGLQDQIESLRWVHENIAAFGGDPGNVTIFGVSGGGRSVQGMCCSPLTRGLIHHAVCHSAGGLNPDYSLPYDTLKEYGKEFVAFCGKKSVAELRQMPPAELQGFYDKFSQPGAGDVRKDFNITGDGYALPYTMDEIIRRGEQADVDYILSTMNGEIHRPPKERVTLASFSPSLFVPRTAIFGNVCKPATDEEAQDFVEWSEAYEMKSAQLAWAELQATQDKKPTYVCTFDHPVPKRGYAAHGDDKYYIFHTMRKFWMPFNEDDERLSQEMMLRWTTFAKTGNPNGEGMVEWTPFTTESPLTMSIDVTGWEMRDRRVPVLERTAKAYIENRRA